ncbi:TonB-dependent siderophore receptor [Halarcobacter anaerophilus]|uniref:TonB-dependent siderophore receptor n=1 Tax=Halarcobacter anaerophilus TaxID=877500 RepID=UPI000698B0A7|nr:TonB-dependent receptor [Halarcobacter anaerophilus]
MNLLKKSLIAPSLAILLYTNLHANESFTLEEMSLKEAIKTISKKANIPYMVDSKLLKDKKSQKIENIQGLKNALDKILQSSGLKASIIDGTIIIKKKSIPQSSNSLGNVEIISTNATEDTDSYTIDSMNTATKLNLSIKDTPQSVVVITNQKIEDNNWESIDDIVSNIAGIQPSKYDTDRTYIMARGFEIDYYQIDGMPTSYTGYQQQDLSIYDRVEIVKGANGLMTGAGNPAAAINLVRKHANSKKLTGDITLKAGSWDRYKGSIDITTPLNEAKTVRARIVASYADEESYKDYYSKETSVFYGVIDADISDNTRLSLGASYQENRPEGTTWGGVPAYFSDGSSTSFHPEDSFTPD